MEKENLKEIINLTDVANLQNASMDFPTWELFGGLLEEVKDSSFPSDKFGKKPMGCSNNTIIPVTGTAELKRMIGKNKYVGIDIPVLLKQDGIESKGTICIVGESALREIKDFKTTNDILLGTPYAVHQGFNCPLQCNVYKKIFSDLLKAGYSLYLTDIIKIWWKDKNLKIDKDVDEAFLKKELAKIGSDAIIVALGKKAADGLEKMGYKFICLPHTSRQNWNNWKLKIFMKAVFEEGVDYAKKLYPCIESKTNEVIVANEAVKEILKSCINNMSFNCQENSIENNL
ncbi:MAG: hypothetical protein IKQ59_13855 [Prevotella sp.]|nr:hypothetical protein [Prevotella sp.]